MKYEVAKVAHQKLAAEAAVLAAAIVDGIKLLRLKLNHDGLFNLAGLFLLRLALFSFGMRFLFLLIDDAGSADMVFTSKAFSSASTEKGFSVDECGTAGGGGGGGGSASPISSAIPQVRSLLAK